MSSSENDSNNSCFLERLLISQGDFRQLLPPPEEYLDKLIRIRRLFDNKPVTGYFGDYPYVRLPLTDFDPPMNPQDIETMAELLVTQLLVEHRECFNQANLIVSEADRGGGPLTQAVAQRLNLPYVLANWYPNETPGQLIVSAKVGFSGNGQLCLNGIKGGEKVIVVDDLLSRGGTLIGLTEALSKGGAEVLMALMVGEKVDQNGRNNVGQKYSFPIETLVPFVVDRQKTRVIR